MRIFVAGASGVIGRRLIPLLVCDGHQVAGMTRSPEKVEALRELEAEPVVCDVFDAGALTGAVKRFRPELVMDQLTDLPDERDRIAEFAARNNRIRTEGTRNLLAAAQEAGARRFLAQSIAWTPPAGGEAVAEHERLCCRRAGSWSGTGPSTAPARTGNLAGSHRRHGSTLRRPPARRWRWWGPPRGLWWWPRSRSSGLDGR